MRLVTRADLDGLTCAVLLSLYGGGGQAGAAACVLPESEADARLGEIVTALKRNG